jgi:hypothetical protein
MSVMVTARDCAGLIRRTLEGVAEAVAFLRRDAGNKAAEEDL